MRRRSGLTLVEALIFFVVLCGVWWALLPGLFRANRPNRSGSTNTRLLAQAAQLYASGSFFPRLPGSQPLEAPPVRAVGPTADWLVWVAGPPCGLLVLLLGGVLLGELNRGAARAYRPGPCAGEPG